jgi:hypothetical protein
MELAKFVKTSPMLMSTLNSRAALQKLALIKLKSSKKMDTVRLVNLILILTNH